MGLEEIGLVDAAVQDLVKGSVISQLGVHGVPLSFMCLLLSSVNSITRLRLISVLKKCREVFHPHLVGGTCVFISAMPIS